MTELETAKKERDIAWDGPHFIRRGVKANKKEPTYDEVVGVAHQRDIAIEKYTSLVDKYSELTDKYAKLTDKYINILEAASILQRRSL